MKAGEKISGSGSGNGRGTGDSDTARQYSRLQDLHGKLSREYELLKVKLEEMEVEKAVLMERVFHYRTNRRLVTSGSLEKTGNWSVPGEEMEVYFKEGERARSEPQLLVFKRK